MAVVVFALAKSLFRELAFGDVDDGDGEADHLIGFIADGLVADQKGPGMTIGIGLWDGEFEIVEGLPKERASDVWFESREEFGDHHPGQASARWLTTGAPLISARRWLMLM